MTTDPTTADLAAGGWTRRRSVSMTRAVSDKPALPVSADLGGAILPDEVTVQVRETAVPTPWLEITVSVSGPVALTAGGQRRATAVFSGTDILCEDPAWLAFLVEPVITALIADLAPEEDR